jgi:glycosyltransferase involved in cell wall biosynthesis
MRVTHVITRLIVGGAQENTIASVLGLRQKPGLEVKLISGKTSGPEGSLESAFEATPGVLRILPELVRPVQPWSDLTAFFKLTRMFRHDPPDIVHTHSGKAGVLGRLAAARARVPIIVHTIHGPSFGPFQGWISNTLFRAAERRAGRVTSHFVVVADAMRDQYLQAGIGRPDHYTKILSGFDLSPFLNAQNNAALRSRLGIAPEHVVIGTISRITALKGFEDLVEIAPPLIRARPNVRFLIIGDGNLRQRVEKQVRDLGLARNFIFAGLVEPFDVPAHLGLMDVVMHLSRREGLPRALPQAMAASRPVVAYDCDGAREVCIDNKTGFLLPPGERVKLLERLQQLACDPALRARLGANGREYVASRFRVQQMIDDLHALYLRLSN